MQTTKIHRRYPESGWEFRGIETLTTDEKGKKVNITYYTGKDRGKAFRAVEIASGYNYIVGTTRSDRSYSRRYTKTTAVPAKYRKIVAQLVKIHKRTKWNEGKGYLNMN